MLETIASLNKYAEEAGVTEPSLLNFCVTDGSSIVVSRYISSRKDEAASLVYAVLLLFVLYTDRVHPSGFLPEQSLTNMLRAAITKCQSLTRGKT